MEEPPPNARADEFKQRELAAIALILLAALGMRTVSIGREAAWFDEVSTLQHLDSATLGEFIARCRDLNPYPPVHLALEYYWSQIFGPSVLAQRILALFIGMGSLAALYGLVRYLFNRRTAAFATVWMALMPWHVYYSHEIRFYGLTILLTIGSMWSFVAMTLNPAPRRMAMNFVLNGFLTWTHPLTALAVVAQGVQLLIFHRSAKRLIAAWFALHALLAASIVAFFLRQNVATVDEVTGWIPVPTLTGRESSLQAFAMVAAGAWKVDGSPEAAPDAPWGPTLLAAYPWLAGVLIVMTLLASIYALVALFRSPSGTAPVRSNGIRRVEVASLLVLWYALPPLVLFFVSHAWRPILTTRYLLFAMPALYVLVGYALSTRRAVIAAAAIAIPAVLYLGFHFPGPNRIPWDRIVSHMEARSLENPGIVVELPFAADAIRYYWRGTEPSFLLPLTPTGPLLGDAATPRQCWVVTGGVGDNIVAEQLRAHGTVVSHTRFTSNDRIVSVIDWRPHPPS